MVARLFSRAAPQPADEDVNPLAEYFLDNPDRLIDKWDHYFEVYHRHFADFRGKSPVVLEIGVWHGGSLQMWRDYFGSGCRIVGIDSNPRCLKFADADTTILIGDQEDREFLASVRTQVPHIDILIDDGGHTMRQQITTFEELYPHLQPRGIYLCEDLHTSLWERFGGGARRAGTFIEYSKALIDRLHAWHSQEPQLLDVTDFTRSTFGLHFYDSILVIEKRPISSPTRRRTGTPVFASSQ
jgi:SAM-dependent methyltransferase